MRKKQLEQEYRAWKRQSTPDLWERIEGELKANPRRFDETNLAERDNNAQLTIEDASEKTGQIPAYGNTKKRKNGDKKSGRKMKYYSGAAAAAAVIILYTAVSGWQMGTGLEEDMAGGGIKLENTIQIEEDLQAGTLPSENQEENKNGGQFLELKEKQFLALPKDAVTVPEDSSYFSEAVLGDTELLCSGKVEDVSLEYDENGRAVKVVYQLLMDQIYYAEDYISSQGSIVITSPIVKAEGDEVYILYQLQKESSYLLPLQKQEGNWELIYPFAPQIQVTGDESYLFHSGYISLVNQETEVVAGSQEGTNDYFYDRMLLRQDENFPSEFLSLVKEQMGKRVKN